jgi:lipoate-protein ligase A
MGTRRGVKKLRQGLQQEAIEPIASLRPATTGQAWRLIPHEEGSPAWNMAVDEAMLEAVIEGIAPPTLRLYRWEKPAISLGRLQNVSQSVDVDQCRELNVELVRRPTGGRGILHGGDQTLSIAVPVQNLGSEGRSVVASYRFLSRGLIHALRKLNLSLDFGSCERHSERGGDCFASRSRVDLLTRDGQKLIGSAQCRRRDTILQQTSLRHRSPKIMAERVFLGQTAPDYFPLEDLDDRIIAAAIQAGFEEALEITLELAELTMWELERAVVLLQTARVSQAT